MDSAVSGASSRRHVNLPVQQVSHRPVELRVFKHHVQIVALLPMGLAASCAFDQLVEFRARQRIGNADADLVRPRASSRSRVARMSSSSSPR